VRRYVPAIILTISVLIVAYETYYVQQLIANGNVCGCSFPVPLYIPTFFAVGVLAGIALVKLLPEHPQDRYDLDAIAKLFEKEEEWFIVRSIMERGSILQSEVSERFGKVRASRAVGALEAREIVRRERVGKTYVILPGPALKEMLVRNQ
jgi:uncharacterized membrane protein